MKKRLDSKRNARQWRLKIWLVAAALSVCGTVVAQDERPWEHYFNRNGMMEDAESGAWEETFELLSDLEQHPMDINSATREDLERLPFLTDRQVEDICAYLYQYGAMRSPGELAMIESLDFDTRQMLQHFIHFSSGDEKHFPKLQNIARYGKNDLIVTGKIPFYKRRGDEKGYLGYQYKHSFRYTFQYGDYVKAGLVGAQDAGEPFFANKNKWGYDYYSYYVLLRKLGRLKTLAAGRYRVNFGMGLVINNDFSLGKMATLSTLGRRSNNIRAHSSRMEANYLQGVAATVGITKELDVSAFVSYRDIDATLNSGDETIATLLTSGYHRTESELRRKHNASELLAGANISWFSKGFHAGATAVYNAYDKDIAPKTSQRYRRYYAAGNHFYNVGVNYGYTGHRLSFRGETATGGCGALATVNSLSYQLTDAVGLMALQRFYSYKYYALHAGSFSAGGSVQNENGVFLGMTWRASRAFQLQAYSDFAHFAWPRYQADDASHAWDNLVQAVYTKGNWSFLARYRLKIREKDNARKTALINQTTHRGRLSVAYDRGRWHLKTQGDVAFSDYKDTSFGWMVTQSASYSPTDNISLHASAGYFNTDDYDSRVYTYERGMLYAFSFPSFYGEGIRFALLACADLSRRLMLQGRLTTTNYFDRATISSGLQQVNRSSMTDLELQLRWKF